MEKETMASEPHNEPSHSVDNPDQKEPGFRQVWKEGAEHCARFGTRFCSLCKAVTVHVE